MEPLTLELKLEVAGLQRRLRRLSAFGHPVPAVPELNRTAAIFAARDGTFEIAVGKRMIFDFDREAPIFGIEGWASRNSPRLEDPVEFEAQVVMEAPGCVFLDYKSETFGWGDRAFAARLGGFGEITLRYVLGKVGVRHAHLVFDSAPTNSIISVSMRGATLSVAKQPSGRTRGHLIVNSNSCSVQ
jgi:hypothetical protein